MNIIELPPELFTIIGNFLKTIEYAIMRQLSKYFCKIVDDNKFLIDENGKKKQLSCKNAAKRGHLHVLIWAKANGYKLDIFVSYRAAYGGHLNVLKWVKCNDGYINIWSGPNAAEGGHLEILKWLHENNYGLMLNAVVMRAARRGHLDILKWIATLKYPIPEIVCEIAVQEGHLEILKWAMDNGCKLDDKMRTIEINNQKIIKWLQEE